MRVRLFAAFRERAGTSSVEVDLPASARAGDLPGAVGEAVPALRDIISAARPVVNQEFAAPEQPIREGDELALIPPVSGGEAKRFWLTEEPIDERAVTKLVEDASCGAAVTFVGYVRRDNEGREVDYLEYEAYPGMAEAKLAQVADEIRERWGLERVAIVHRLGRCDVGEASIAIGVASPHRREGFEACHYAIDRIKEIVPIWKREVWKDGAVWIGMHA